MAITFRHDAAGVVLPANEANRKYGQSLVLQQQQQKYAGQQAGYDRMFDAAKTNQQNQFQWGRDVQQNAFQVGRDKALFDQNQQAAEAQRQQAFLDDARKQSSGMIMNDIKNGHYDSVTAKKLQQSLIDEAEALGNPNLDATMRAEALSKIRAKRLLDTANYIEKPPEPSAQDKFDQGIVTRNGVEYQQNAKGDWVPLQQEKPQEQPPPMPTSADDAFRADPKVRKDYMDEAINMETKGGEEPLTPEGRKRAAAAAKKNYEEDHGLGTPTDAPVLAGDTAAVPGAEQSILETGQAPPPAGMPIAPPDPGRPPAPWGTQELSSEQKAELAAFQDAPGQPANQEIALGPGHPDYKPPAKSTGKKDANGYIIMDDGSKVDPRDSAAMKGTGMVQDVVRNFNPDGSPKEVATGDPKWLLESATGSGKSSGMKQPQQQVKVGGKPLAVTPGTLTPQETAARGQIMELPREQRIAALMPYDQELKGKTLDQLLEDPETKAGYDDMTKQGLTTGNYREDMLGHLDEMLQHNVLNAAGQSPPSAYVGMRADEVTDPKAKAEVAKMPRPKTADEMKAVRGKYFIDPNGIIRGTQKQA